MHNVGEEGEWQKHTHAIWFTGNKVNLGCCIPTRQISELLIKTVDVMR